MVVQSDVEYPGFEYLCGVSLEEMLQALLTWFARRKLFGNQMRSRYGTDEVIISQDQGELSPVLALQEPISRYILYQKTPFTVPCVSPRWFQEGSITGTCMG